MNADVLEQFVKSRHINDGFEEELSALAEEDRHSVALLVEILSPSANGLRDLLRLAKESALRDRSSIADVLRTEPLGELLENEKLSRKEKTREIRRVLEMKRYPVLSRIKRGIENCQRVVTRDTGVQLEVPKDFEGDALKVTMTLKRSEDFETAAEKLKRASEHPKTAELFALLRGEDGSE